MGPVRHVMRRLGFSRPLPEGWNGDEATTPANLRRPRPA